MHALNVTRHDDRRKKTYLRNAWIGVYNSSISIKTQNISMIGRCAPLNAFFELSIPFQKPDECSSWYIEQLGLEATRPKVANKSTANVISGHYQSDYSTKISSHNVDISLIYICISAWPFVRLTMRFIISKTHTDTEKRGASDRWTVDIGPSFVLLRSFIGCPMTKSAFSPLARLFDCYAELSKVEKAKSTHNRHPN